MLVSEIAKILGGRMFGDDGEISGIKPLFYAKDTDLSFILWPKDIKAAKTSKAKCLIAEFDLVAHHADKYTNSMIAVEDMASSFVKLKDLSFLVQKKTPVIKENTVIEPGAVIHDNVQIGKNCYIGANSVIGSNAFAPFSKVPLVNLCSLGDVIIKDNVRIGALCTVDKGLIGSTVIGEHTIIDNMVHVGHDVLIGKNVAIAAQSGLAGFVQIGDEVTIFGQVGVSPHCVIGKGARISGKSMVHCDIKPYEIWSGNPSLPHALYLRAYGKLKREGRRNARL